MSVSEEEERISIKRAAVIIGKTEKETLRWVKKNNCGEKIGRRWFLLMSKLLYSFPHLREAMADAEDYTDSRACNT